MTFMTRPEQFADWPIAKRLKAKILADPCAHCLCREPQTVFGKTVCGSGELGRNWWTCTRDGRKPTFELDSETIR